MSFEERNTLVYIFASLVVALIFMPRIYDGTISGLYDGPDGLQIWARAVLWIIPIGIAITIVSVIMAHVLTAIIVRDEGLDDQVDERDKMIASWGTKVTLVLFSFGWIAALIFLATGSPALTALNTMIFGVWLADLAGNLTKSALYRKGMMG